MVVGNHPRSFYPLSWQYLHCLLFFSLAAICRRPGSSAHATSTTDRLSRSCSPPASLKSEVWSKTRAYRLTGSTRPPSFRDADFPDFCTHLSWNGS